MRILSILSRLVLVKLFKELSYFLTETLEIISKLVSLYVQLTILLIDTARVTYIFLKLWNKTICFIVKYELIKNNAAEPRYSMVRTSFIPTHQVLLKVKQSIISKFMPI